MFYSDASIQRPLIISQKPDLLSLTILLVCVLYCFQFHTNIFYFKLL